MHWFAIFILILICLLIGFFLGLLFAPSVKKELKKLYAALVAFILGEFKKIHDKLDAIFAAVKK
jgi:gas vesicle protein